MTAWEIDMTAGSGTGRIYTTDGIFNLRDYGGYPVAGGGRVRSGMLFRSGELSRVSDADLALLDGLGLKTVIDLRSAGERAAAPSRLGPDFAGRILFSHDYVHARPPHARAAEGSTDAQAVRGRFLRAFAAMPFQSKMIGVFRLYLEALAAEQGATLVHCSAGKDRSGIAVALLHACLGVHADDIRADFLLTNEVGAMSNRYADLAASIRASLGEGAPEEAVSAGLRVEPEFLDVMFAAIDEAGGLSTYLHDTLMLAPDVRDRLRANLICQVG